MRKLLRIFAATISLLSLMFCINIPAVAIEMRTPENVTSTDGFSFAVVAASCRQDDTGINLEAGETVTIKGTVSPFSATVKYGLVAPEGKFYGVNSENGILDYTFRMGKSGTYYFAVINNSSVTVSVSGYINY